MNPMRRVTGNLHLFEGISRATYTELFSLWILIMAAFAAAYFSLSTWMPEHGPAALTLMDLPARLFNSIYFSVITGTTTGYGDIIPQGASKVLSMLQSSLSVLIFAVFASKLVSRHQEATLREVHRMTFEGSFTHIRQGLFNVRKDFDRLIHTARTHHGLAEREWETLQTAYLQAQSLVEEIPDLYEGRVHDLHMIDPKRERLLFEAIHRTLERIDMLLIALQEENINWLGEEHSTAELHAFIDGIDAIMPLWRERSPYHRIEEFEDIFALSLQLHERIKSALHSRS